jgi:hypothetical protein
MVTALFAFLWGLCNSPLFYVQEIELAAPDRETYALAARALHVPATASTLFYPVSRLERQVANIPQIQWLEIERVPLHTLRIGVYRRLPVALAPLPGGTCFLIGSDGILAGRVAPGKKPPRLPVMDGLTLTGARPGDCLPEWPAWLVAQTTRTAGDAGLRGAWHLDCSRPFELRLTVGGVEGFLGGTDNLERKIHLFASLLQELQKRGKHPAYIDVRVMERPVWREAGAGAP